MEPMRVPWAIQSYTTDSLPVSSQRCVNYYAEKLPPDSKTDVAVLGCPGIATVYTVDNGPIRGFTVMNDILYVVSGSSLYSVTTGGQITLLGSGLVGFGPVSIANNTFQVEITDGVNGWVYAPSATYKATSAGVASGGSNYAVGDTITLDGGTYSNPAVLVVETVSGSAVATVAVQTSGQYSAKPANPVGQLATSGSGSGASFNVTFSGPPVGFSQITDPNFYPAYTVTFYDEYFILARIGTNIFFFSNILDGTTYGALDYEAATVESNYVKTVVNQQENLLVFCEKSIETWYDTGANDNPFSRYGAATIQRGCASPFTPLKEDNSVFFLGDDLVFYRLDGVLLRRMSTHAIEQAWQKYATVADAFAFSYTFNGHKFIVLQFPSGNATWEFDIATNLWHERVSYNAASPYSGPWRGGCAVTFNNQVLIGDTQSGQIGYLSSDVYTEFGQPMIGLMVAPPTQKDRKRVFISKLEINMRTGTGLNSSQGSDPQVMLEISKDQGETYGNRQPWQSMGKIGAYFTRLIWKKLGASRDWRFRVTISDPVPRAFISTFVTGDIEEV